MPRVPTGQPRSLRGRVPRSLTLVQRPTSNVLHVRGLPDHVPAHPPQQVRDLALLVLHAGRQRQRARLQARGQHGRGVDLAVDEATGVQLLRELEWIQDGYCDRSRHGRVGEHRCRQGHERGL